MGGINLGGVNLGGACKSGVEGGSAKSIPPRACIDKYVLSWVARTTLLRESQCPLRR